MHPSAHYPLASRGGHVPLPIRICVELLPLRWEQVFPAGELLCAQTKGWGCRCLPLFFSCPGAPASDGKKPLEACLSNGWSGINALRGLCPPHRPFGDSAGGCCTPPSLWYCASPLVMGVARSRRELLQLSCHSCTVVAGWLRPASSVLARGSLIVGGGNRACPLRRNGTTFGGYFPASACWHPAHQGIWAEN